MEVEEGGQKEREGGRIDRRDGNGKCVGAREIGSTAFLSDFVLTTLLQYDKVSVIQLNCGATRPPQLWQHLSQTLPTSSPCW